MNMNKNFMVASYEAEVGDNNLTKFIKSAMKDSDEVNKVAPSIHNAGTYRQLGELLDMAKKDELDEDACYQLNSDLTYQYEVACANGNYDVSERLDGMVVAVDMVVDYILGGGDEELHLVLDEEGCEDLNDELNDSYEPTEEELAHYHEYMDEMDIFCTCE